VKKSDVTAAPAAPKVGDDLSAADRDLLLDDPEWVQLRISADLTGEVIRRLDIAECRISNARFVGCDLQGARLVDVVLSGCDLSGALLQDAVLTRVELRDCRLSGLVLNGSKLRDVNIVDCRADSLGLRAVVAERLTCQGVLMPMSDLASANLKVTRVFDCDLTGSDISNLVCDDVRLHGSTLAGLRGVSSLRNVVIDPDQMHDLAIGLFAAHKVELDPERERARTKST
jgi:uncharacterized protein YjbI with pentapeptide repeats